MSWPRRFRRGEGAGSGRCVDGGSRRCPAVRAGHGPGARRASRLLRPFAGLMVLAATMLVGCAPLAPIAPDELPDRIPSGQGLLLLDVDSDFDLKGIDLGSRELKIAGRGHQYRLYLVPSGRYAWQQVRSGAGTSLRIRYKLYKMDDAERRQFSVEEGTVSYPGQLHVRSEGWGWIRVRFANRSSFAMRHLIDEHPDLIARFPVRYTGFQRDDFPIVFQKAARRRVDTAGADGGVEE